jgi:GntR family transcriptional regulator, transcriptional repressor for pyruvate dehydrogenase complex
MTIEPSGSLPSRVTRAEVVAREVETEIADGSLAPGARIGTKDDLRRRFGVAVATINEAVRLLEMRGLIEARPGPGGGVFAAGSPRVAQQRGMLGFASGQASFAECQAVRNALEPLVCREAARHRRDEDIRALRMILASMERHAEEPGVYLDLDWALHRRIARMCRNAPLHSIYLTLIDVLQDAGAAGSGAGEADLAVHRELVDAIAAGEGPGLDAVIDRHTAAAA